MMRRLLLLAAAATLFAATSAWPQTRLPVISGEYAVAPKAAKAAPRLRLDTTAVTTKARAPRTQAQLSPLPDAAIEELRAVNARNRAKRIAIGVNRPIEGAALPTAGDMGWTAVEGGRAAQATVTSPEAAALRLAIDVTGVPGDVEMVFYGSATPERLFGPVRVGEIRDRSVPFWSPATEGDSQTVEFFVPGDRDAAALPLRIVAASHLLAAPSSLFRKTVQDIGDAAACEVDLPCSTLAGNSAFHNAAESVAHMLFIDGSQAFLCTGNLLNDSDATSQIPWFHSANHCFDNENPPYKTAAQMQAVASTLDTYWFFEAATCNSLAVPNYVLLTHGATYLYNNPQTDTLFVRLNDPAPAGAFFAGSDPNPIAVGANVVDIHHPQGDLKKVSQGSVLDITTPDGGVGGGNIPLIRIGWTSGVTEGGSSGSGIFTFTGSQYLLRGGLFAGTDDQCRLPTRDRYDYFSRFDLAYPSIAAYLNGTAPGTDYTDLWWNPNESGWGLNLIQHPSHKIFAVWYTYGLDGKRTWFVMSDGTWTTSLTYTGALYSVSGPPFNSNTFDSSRVRVTPVGNATLTFGDDNNGTWTYSVNGVSGVKAITRQPF